MLRLLFGLCLLLLAECGRAVDDEGPAPPSSTAGLPPSDAGPIMSVPRAPLDAGPTTSALDAGADGGPAPACDPTRCPVSNASLPFDTLSGPIDYVQRACCTGALEYSPRGALPPVLDGTCGVLFPSSYDWDEVAYCEPIVEGVLDATCLDTVVEGEVVQGCRRPDGECGHQTPGWGCHDVFRSYWERDIDGLTLPNPFNCTPYGEPCTRSAQCCSHPNYGNVCWPNPGDEVDAGDADADVRVGYCEYDEYVANEPSPFPR